MSRPLACPMLNQANDCVLMVAVASHRDPQAFEELYRRYQRQAFAVAYHVSGSQQAAEEAVQQAMVRVWNKAARFDPSGNPRAWILRVVTRETLRILRDKRRDARREGQLASVILATTASSAPTEEEDRVPELHKALGELPGMERQILTLYYAGGMTQHEVARALALPQRTVSYKLKGALHLLRANLARAGLSLPLSADALGEALRSGCRIPSGLHDKVLKALAPIPGEGPTPSLAHGRGVAAPLGKAALVAAAVAVAVAASAAAWWTRETPATVLAGNLNRRQEAAPNVPVQVPGGAGATGFPARWTFEGGPPKDLRAFQGVWRWQPGAQGRGEMCTEGPLPAEGGTPRSNVVGLLLPQELPRQPLVVAVHGYVPKGQYGLIGVDGYWTDLRGQLPHRRWRRTGTEQTSNRTCHDLLYFIGPYVIKRGNGQLLSVLEYRAPYPASRINLIVERITVTAITLRSLESGEWVGPLRDVPETIRRAGLVPTEIPFDPFIPSKEWGGVIE